MAGFDLGSVFVTFQAKTDQLVAGINAAKVQIGSVGESLNTMGNISLGVGAAITGVMGVLVAAAGAYQVANAKLTAGLNAVKNAGEADVASSGASAAATQVLIDKKATLVAQIAAEQDAVEKATQKYGANSVQVQQAQAKLATYQTQLETTNSKLAVYATAIQAAGLDVAKTTDYFDKLAESNTQYGFTVEDSLSALTSQMTVFKDVKDATNANSIAMDLARYSGLSLADAAKQVDLAYQGQGRALKAFGINIKDAATGQEALSELQAQVAGQATAYSKTAAGQAESAKAKIQAVAATLGQQLLPYVARFLTAVSNVITKVSAWAQANPALVSQIIKIAAVLGPALLGLGVLLKFAAMIINVWPTLVTLWETGTTVIEAVTAAVGGLTLAAGLWIIAIIAVIAIGYEVITHWTQVRNFFEAMWQDIVGFFKKYWLDILFVIAPFIALPIVIIANWGKIKDFFIGLWGDIKTGAKDFWADFKDVFSEVGDFFAKIGDFILNGILDPVELVVKGIDDLIKGANKLPGVNIPLIPDIPKFASGITNFGGGWAMVGDVAGTDSGELINLPAGSNVYSNAQSKDMLGNTQPQGGGTVNVTISTGAFMGTAADARAFAEQVQRQLNRYNRQVGA